jgi:copper chaperone CopZ
MRIPQSLGAAKRALLPAVLLALAGGTAHAGVLRLVVPVRGMTCPLCTRGVEESIRSLGGIGSVSADLASGLVRVEAAEGKSLVLQQVRLQIERAGFRIGGEAEVVASVRFLIGSEGRITMRISGTSYAFQVLEGGDFRRLIHEHPGLKGDYVVDFRLHDHTGWKPAAASITGFEVLEPKPAPATGR